jgi:hypothetical protein
VNEMKERSRGRTAERAKDIKKRKLTVRKSKEANKAPTATAVQVLNEGYRSPQIGGVYRTSDVFHNRKESGKDTHQKWTNQVVPMKEDGTVEGGGEVNHTKVSKETA